MTRTTHMAQALYEAFVQALADHQDDATPLEAIGVLELVKAELIASVAEQDDEGESDGQEGDDGDGEGDDGEDEDEDEDGEDEDGEDE